MINWSHNLVTLVFGRVEQYPEQFKKVITGYGIMIQFMSHKFEKENLKTSHLWLFFFELKIMKDVFLQFLSLSQSSNIFLHDSLKHQQLLKHFKMTCRIIVITCNRQFCIRAGVAQKEQVMKSHQCCIQKKFGTLVSAVNSPKRVQCRALIRFKGGKATLAQEI